MWRYVVPDIKSIAWDYLLAHTERATGKGEGNRANSYSLLGELVQRNQGFPPRGGKASDVARGIPRKGRENHAIYRSSLGELVQYYPDSRHASA